MPAPDLLMPRPLLPQTVAALEREFTVHKLWEAKDPDAVVAGLAGWIAWRERPTP